MPVDPIPSERISVDPVAFGDAAMKGGPVTGQETDVLLLISNVEHTVGSHTDSIARLEADRAAMNATLQSVQADVQSVQADLVSFKEEAQQQFEGLDTHCSMIEINMKDLRTEMKDMRTEMNHRFDVLTELIQSMHRSSSERLASPVITFTPPVSSGGIHLGRLRIQYGSLDGVRKYTIQVFEHV